MLDILIKDQKLSRRGHTFLVHGVVHGRCVGWEWILGVRQPRMSIRRTVYGIVTPYFGTMGCVLRQERNIHRTANIQLDMDNNNGGGI